MFRFVIVALTLALAGPAAASPCDPLVAGMTGGTWSLAPDDARAAALACKAAFVADPASQPRLGAGGSNVLGVNHRLGDLSFVLAHGRLPTAADAEAERMRLHLDLALAILAARPATHPELAARRADILHHLSTYRDKGTVPDNLVVARRNPVFIDGAGHICAVGYLIQETVGRELAEAVARRHRLDYLGDMDFAPLAAWVAASGLTVDELALIQPAYSLPPIETWSTFVGPLRMGVRPPDGPYEANDFNGLTTLGAWQGGHMQGVWRRLDATGREVAAGELVRGRGRWSGRHPNGALAVEGEVVRDAPSGLWRAYYPSGNLAIEGELRDAVRVGTWSYHHDAPGAPLMARGRYQHVERGLWEHYDRTGRHVATSDVDHDAVTWYDDAGAAVACEIVGRIELTPPAGVQWHPQSRRVTRAVIDLQAAKAWEDHAFTELELRFDADARLTTLLARIDRGDAPLAPTLVLTLAAGRPAEAWYYVPANEGGAVEARWRLDLAGVDVRVLERVVQRAERGARRHGGGPALADSDRLARAAMKVLGPLGEAARTPVDEIDARWVDGLRFTPVAPPLAPRPPAPALVAGCEPRDPKSVWPPAWACLTEPGAQVRSLVTHIPEMVTSGTNFVHLDELAAALLWSRMPDRVLDDSAGPEWFVMPELSEALRASEADLYGELSSTHAPLVGRRKR